MRVCPFHLLLRHTPHQKLKKPDSIRVCSAGNIPALTVALESGFLVPGHIPGQQGTQFTLVLYAPAAITALLLSLVFLQYFFELLYPANSALTEIYLEMAGKLSIDHAMHQFLELVQFPEMFFFSFAHDPVGFFQADCDGVYPSKCLLHSKVESVKVY